MIATSLPFTKIKELKEEKIVKPDWIVDCVRDSKLLDYQPYLLYLPQSMKNQPPITDLINVNANLPTTSQPTSQSSSHQSDLNVSTNQESSKF